MTAWLLLIAVWLPQGITIGTNIYPDEAACLRAAEAVIAAPPWPEEFPYTIRCTELVSAGGGV